MEFTEEDVFFGRGRGSWAKERSGTKRFLNLCRDESSEYRTKRPGEKHQVVRRIYADVVGRGGRFFARDRSGKEFVEMEGKEEVLKRIARFMKPGNFDSLTGSPSPRKKKQDDLERMTPVVVKRKMPSERNATTSTATVDTTETDKCENDDEDDGESNVSNSEANTSTTTSKTIIETSIEGTVQDKETNENRNVEKRGKRKASKATSPPNRRKRFKKSNEVEKARDDEEDDAHVPRKNDDRRDREMERPSPMSTTTPTPRSSSSSAAGAIFLNHATELSKRARELSNVLSEPFQFPPPHRLPHFCSAVTSFRRRGGGADEGTGEEFREIGRLTREMRKARRMSLNKRRNLEILILEEEVREHGGGGGEDSLDDDDDDDDDDDGSTGEEEDGSSNVTAAT